MPNPLADEARLLNDAALGEAVNEAYRELFNLQFQKGTRQLQDATTVKRARRQIARLRTILRERQLAVVAGAPLAPLAEAPAPALSPQKKRALDERRVQEEAAVVVASSDTDVEVPLEDANTSTEPSAEAASQPPSAGADAEPAAADPTDTPATDAQEGR